MDGLHMSRKMGSLPTITVLIAAMLSILVPSSQAAAPTEFEQYMVELINRARANPGAEVTRLSGEVWGDVPGSPPASADLNEGLPPGHLSDTAVQPLAINFTVAGVSETYANTLIANDALDHFVGGTTVSSRLAAGGYTLLPTPAGAAESLGAQVSANPLSITQDIVDQQYEDWFINNNVAFRVDRLTLLETNYKEIGASFQTSTDYTFYGASTPNGVISVVNYTYRDDDPFITGVAFNDVDGDDFYTPGIGEALGGIGIDVYDAESKLFITSGQTFDSGGYSLQLPDGNYDIVFHDPSAGDFFVNDINLSGANVKVDYIGVPEPESVALIVMALSGVALVCSRRHLGSV